MSQNTALLITLCRPGDTERVLELREKEISSLLETLGVEVPFSLRYTVKEINPNTLIGPGQAAEAAAVAADREVDEVIINEFTSPRQEKNLEKIFSLPVTDRENVILSIFFQNAHSREARLQIEKAEAEYLKPRLQNREASLSQQRGGVRGAKGEGERKIELERRRINERIEQLKKEIAGIRKIRDTQRKDRKENSVFSFALTGYTNAGKSSLMKRLTGSDVLVENKLFATLDTTTRSLLLPNGQEVLLSDTVGFITNLPHRLIDAFSSTLEEALDSDAIIMVADLSHPDAWKSYETTRDTIKELGALDKVKLLVLNKTDDIYDEFAYHRLKNTGFTTVETSVKENRGIDDLLKAMSRITEEGFMTVTYPCPMDGSGYKKVTRDAVIVATEYRDDDMLLTLRIPRHMKSYFDMEFLGIEKEEEEWKKWIHDPK